jgi:hypothetical protein
VQAIGRLLSRAVLAVSVAAQAREVAHVEHAQRPLRTLGAECVARMHCLGPQVVEARQLRPAANDEFERACMVSDSGPGKRAQSLEGVWRFAEGAMLARQLAV